MTKAALEALPKALRILASEIKAPDDIPSACLRDASDCILKLQDIIHRARVEFFRDGSDAKVMQRMIKILDEMP